MLKFFSDLMGGAQHGTTDIGPSLTQHFFLSLPESDKTEFDTPTEVINPHLFPNKSPLSSPRNPPVVPIYLRSPAPGARTPNPRPGRYGKPA